MNRYVMLERNDRERRLLRGLVLLVYGSAIPRGSSAFQPLPHIVLRNYRRSRTAERRISTRMIAVIMRIDHKAYRLVRDPQAFQRRLNLLRQRRELVVHNHDAIISNRCRDVSARAL